MKLLLSASILLWTSFVQANLNSVLTANKKKQLVHMLKHDCGSCHGMTLKGGLGPSLLPKNLSKFDRDYLFQVIKFGRQEKAMPPWGKIMTDNEIDFLIQYLRKLK